MKFVDTGVPHRGHRGAPNKRWRIESMEAQLSDILNSSDLPSAESDLDMLPEFPRLLSLPGPARQNRPRERYRAQPTSPE